MNSTPKHWILHPTRTENRSALRSPIKRQNHGRLSASTYSNGGKRTADPRPRGGAAAQPTERIGEGEGCAMLILSPLPFLNELDMPILWRGTDLYSSRRTNGGKEGRSEVERKKQHGTLVRCVAQERRRRPAPGPPRRSLLQGRVANAAILLDFPLGFGHESCVTGPYDSAATCSGDAWLVGCHMDILGRFAHRGCDHHTPILADTIGSQPVMSCPFWSARTDGQAAARFSETTQTDRRIHVPNLRRRCVGPHNSRPPVSSLEDPDPSCQWRANSLQNPPTEIRAAGKEVEAMDSAAAPTMATDMPATMMRAVNTRPL
jgi:hypothetical protein